MVRTLQNRRLPARLSHNRGSVMPADVVESAQPSIVVPDNYDRLPRKQGGNKLSWTLQLIRTRNKLPRSAENAKPLHFSDATVRIPRRRYSRGLRQRGPVVVAGKNLLDRSFHNYGLE